MTCPAIILTVSLTLLLVVYISFAFKIVLQDYDDNLMSVRRELRRRDAWRSGAAQQTEFPILHEIRCS
jgi:hypothetical protein